jgi:hypothetical protein
MDNENLQMWVLQETRKFNLRWKNPVTVFNKHQNMLGLDIKCQKDPHNVLNDT